MDIRTLRTELNNLLIKDPQADIIIEQMLDLWRVWEENKEATSTQEFYRGLAALKQFNALMFKARPVKSRGKNPPLDPNHPMAKLLNKHLQRSEVNADDPGENNGNGKK